MRATFRLHDVARCRALVRGKRFSGRNADAERIGKAIADEIVAAFTGVRGVSDTELAFVSNRSGAKEIFVMDADGGNQRPLPIDIPIDYGFSHEQMVSWGP